MNQDKKPAARFRELLAGSELIICPGVVNALFARMAERAGFDLIYASGAGIANCHLGAPDVGLLTMTELLEIDRRMAGSVGIPVLADVDTGYGGALNVFRTVKEFEAAGVAGIQIEDQVNPKRCGHFADKRVVDLHEMLERVIAAREAATDPDFVVVARTDALAVHGLDEAIRRGNAFAEAGADVVFIEAPESVDEMKAIPSAIGAPVLINVVEGGLTPALAAVELHEMGYRIALYANALMRMAAAGVERGLQTIRSSGGTVSLATEMISWSERQALVDLDGWLEKGRSIEERAGQLARSRGESEASK